jgi:nitrite reductase/ring-hydroxylating ferredoxin subunit
MPMIAVCRADEVTPGEGKRIDLPGRPPLAIFKVDGAFYATDDTCTHGEASLCDGFVEGNVIECPYHAGTFDICTGKALTLPAADPIRTYKVTVDGDQVCVELD